MRYRLLIIISLFVLSCTQREAETFVVLQTTDLHGVFGREMSGITGYIKNQREKYGNNLILLDGGDNLQGTPEVFFANYVDTLHTHIYSELFNWLSYDAITPGNHDIEAGRKVFDKVYSEIRADVICANAIVERTGEPYFKPYVVYNRKGWKIAVMGILTPFATEWIPQNLRGGIRIDNPEKAAIYWTNKIYEEENPDILIGLFHAGWGDSFTRDTSESASNIGAWIARNVPGFHLVCCGHVHDAKTDFLVNVRGDTVHMMEAGAKASHIGRAEIRVQPREQGQPGIHISTGLLASRELPPYYSYEKKIEPFLVRGKEYNSKEFCHLEIPVYSRDAMYGPSAWTDEIHRVQLAHVNSGPASGAGASVSFVSPAARNLMIEAGPLQMKDFIRALPYENTISIVRMTGKEIVRFLEYAYALRIDDPRSPAYNFDSAAGVLYRVHKNNPAGSRIEILSMADGSSFYPDEEYHVVMSTYRARGGGGHMTVGVGLSADELPERTLWVSEKDIRTIFRESLAARNTVRPQPLDHWRYL
ncbi:MAG TPA: 5'-nucleotidase C-terminal domain-containing protein [Bacteroidales bacterium]|nr:5'-nucleotidase C-terminal domain-containing protein [Bacteroidales bacterium]